MFGYIKFDSTFTSANNKTRIMKLTIENLKARKNYIIAKVGQLGCSDNLKSFMSIMMMEVESGFNGSIYDLVMEVYNMHYRTRSRKVSVIAEICGNGIKSNGREVNYNAAKYL